MRQLVLIWSLLFFLASCTVASEPDADAPFETSTSTPPMANLDGTSATVNVIIATEPVQSTVMAENQSRPATPFGSVRPDPESQRNIPDARGELVVTPQPFGPAPVPRELLLAVEDLARLLDLDVSQIDVVGFGEAEWPDTGLGCPEPEETALPIVTPGYKITLEVEDVRYVYHTDQNLNLVLCEDGQPAAPPDTE